MSSLVFEHQHLMLTSGNSTELLLHCTAGLRVSNGSTLHIRNIPFLHYITLAKNTNEINIVDVVLFTESTDSRVGLGTNE